MVMTATEWTSSLIWLALFGAAIAMAFTHAI